MSSPSSAPDGGAPGEAGAEAELARARSALGDRSALLDVALDAVFARDLDRRITHWNRGAEDAYGWSRGESLGRDPRELLRTEYPVPLADIEAMVAATGRWEGDLVQHTRHGRRLVVESRWAAQRDLAGNLVGILEANRDVTARREADQALRESEERFRQLADNIDDVFLLRTTEPLRYLYVNPAVEAVFGVRPESVYRDPSSLFSLVHPDDAGLLPDPATEVAGDAPTEWEFRIRRPEGGVRWLRARSFPIRGQDGAVSRVAGVVEDITAHHETAEALGAARAEADRANRATSEFLSRMSHELRTPLNSIIGFGQLLELDLVGEQQRSAVQQILKGGHHLLALINEILDISRIETGRLTLSLEPVRVGEVVAEAVELIRPLAEGHNLTLSNRVPPGGGDHVRADRQRLKQVLLNLLANAAKYNRVGGAVTVDCEPAGDRVRVQVADTGRGIAEEDLEQLFTPFERLGAEQAGVEGTGLGLTLSRRLAEAMGGTVGVVSTPGEGSTFWIELAPAAALDGGGGDGAASPLTGVVATRSAGTILYIEDNLSNVRLVESILARARPGTNLLVAMQGGLGVELAREHRPDVILLDLNLPDITGEEALSRLAADSRTAGIPVVVLSADATAGKIARLRARGASAYLTKPFDVGQFLQAVDDPAAAGAGPAPSTAAAHDPAGRAEVLDEKILAGLHELADADSTVTEHLVSVFLRESASQLEALRVAAADADATTLAAVAHSLRGSSASLGAQRLARRCTDLQDLARAGDVDAAVLLIGDIVREFGSARTALCAEFGVTPR